MFLPGCSQSAALCAPAARARAVLRAWPRPQRPWGPQGVARPPPAARSDPQRQPPGARRPRGPSSNSAELRGGLVLPEQPGVRFHFNESPQSLVWEIIASWKTEASAQSPRSLHGRRALRGDAPGSLLRPSWPAGLHLPPAAATAAGFRGLSSPGSAKVKQRVGKRRESWVNWK